MSNKTQRSNKKPKSSRSTLRSSYTGILDVTRSGTGYVMVEGLKNDIKVAAHLLHTAIEGDTVMVKVLQRRPERQHWTGKITKVVKRKTEVFTGVVEARKDFLIVYTTQPSLPAILVYPGQAKGAGTGDKVVVHVLQWSGEQEPVPTGEITDILNKDDVNDTAMKEILIENGFPLAFPKEVLQEADQLSADFSAEQRSGRRDMRDTLTFTIDPVDAKDFDDALSFKPLEGGRYEIGVHIADVSHYVRPGSSLDQEAYGRATSVYLADRVLPMLPEKISNELCSLRPNEDKLTFSVVFEMNKEGKVEHSWIGRTLIHSDHRFSYEQAQQVIETGQGTLSEAILPLHQLARKLRAARFAKGAINFSSVEVRFQLDENARPIGVVLKESKAAHQLIEEFMLLANRSVATYAEQIKVKGEALPFPYRVHDAPDAEKLRVYVAFAAKLGYKMDVSSPQAIASSFNELLARVDGKPEQLVLEQLGIRTMSKAIYTTENIGHYGLAFADYCHFTSPIRRYPDVMVHRIIASCLAGEPQVDAAMEAKCQHCSARERKAMDAERAAQKYKQVEYMQQFVGEEFDAVISGVAHFGFWAETVETKCEGMVPISLLNLTDDFEFVSTEYALKGHMTGKVFRMGDAVRIRVAAANLEKRQLDYVLAGEEHRPAPSAQRKGRKTSGGRAPRKKSSHKAGGRRKKKH